jgi:hypothetical protein
LLDLEAKLSTLGTALMLGSSILVNCQVLELATVVDAHVLLDLLHLPTLQQPLECLEVVRVGVGLGQYNVVLHLAVLLHLGILLAVCALLCQCQEACLRSQDTAGHSSSHDI